MTESIDHQNYHLQPTEFRRKPEVFEAMQFIDYESGIKILEWVSKTNKKTETTEKYTFAHLLLAAEGVAVGLELTASPEQRGAIVQPGDWVVKTTDSVTWTGSFYHIKGRNWWETNEQANELCGPCKKLVNDQNGVNNAG